MAASDGQREVVTVLRSVLIAQPRFSRSLNRGCRNVRSGSKSIEQRCVQVADGAMTVLAVFGKLNVSPRLESVSADNDERPLAEVTMVFIS